MQRCLNSVVVILMLLFVRSVYFSLRFEAFKVEHMSEINSLASDSGLWMDATVHFSSGNKP